jgi:hypothetical protein
MKNYNLNVDFESLKNQKAILINMIQGWGESSDPDQKADAEEAEGILELLDSIQDQAVDVHGESEDDVFNVEFTVADESINGIVLHKSILREELHEYYPSHRRSLIDELIIWIGECKRESEKQIMKDDLRTLMDVKDEYILSSNSTNSYLYQGCSEFEDTCKELIELSQSLNLKKA